ncbi:MAG: hypothetical protein ABW146_08445 [Candidatus Sedimenticola sp. 6PFRAG7]
MSTKPARLSTSERLQRVDQLLSDGREYSTLEIAQLANVCAVNSIIDELRSNGRDIRCRREGNLWFYKRWDL